MNNVELIQKSLAGLFAVHAEDGYARVITHCLYPTNSFVQVAVRSGLDTFVVSDEGGAIREIESAGAYIENPDKMISQMIHQMGLKVVKGVIRSPECNASQLGFAIASVSNASRSVADWLFSHTRVRPHHNFKEVVANYLKFAFPDNVRAETIVGESNKAHRFDNIIHLSNGRRMVVDAVVPDPSSINARVVANMDVKNAGHPDVEQRIIYDDADDWSPADLNLLQVGATLIRYSQAPNVLKRLAAA